LYSDKSNNALRPQHANAIIRGMNHAQECVTRKQRCFDLLVAVAPVAGLGDDWEKRLNSLILQLLGDQFFVARARPNRIPARLAE
jgi:hypothetical protein